MNEIAERKLSGNRERGSNLRNLARSKWMTLIIAGVVFVVLGYAIWRDWDIIQAFEWRLNPLNLLLLAIFHTLSLSSSFAAWHLMIARLSGHGKLRVNMRIYSLSLLARRIPLPFWYVGSRVVLYQAENIPVTIVLTATTLELALLAVGGVICYLVFLPWFLYTQALPWYIPLALVGIAGLVILIRPGLLIDLINAIQKIRKKTPVQIVVTRKDMLIWGLLYLAPWFLDGIGLYFTLTAFLPLPNQVAYIISVSTVSMLVAMLTMLLPAGFGLKELTMGTLLSIWMPLSAAIVLSLVYRLLQTIVETLLAWMTQYNADGLPPKEPFY